MEKTEILKEYFIMVKKLIRCGEVFSDMYFTVDKEYAFAQNLNDVFYDMGGADFEELYPEDIPELYSYVFDSDGNEKPYGGVVWACHKRKARPSLKYEKQLKEKGVWNDTLESYSSYDEREK